MRWHIPVREHTVHPQMHHCLDRVYREQEFYHTSDCLCASRTSHRCAQGRDLPFWASFEGCKHAGLRHVHIYALHCQACSSLSHCVKTGSICDCWYRYENCWRAVYARHLLPFDNGVKSGRTRGPSPFLSASLMAESLTGSESASACSFCFRFSFILIVSCLCSFVALNTSLQGNRE